MFELFKCDRLNIDLTKTYPKIKQLKFDIQQIFKKNCTRNFDIPKQITWFLNFLRDALF